MPQGDTVPLRARLLQPPWQREATTGHVYPGPNNGHSPPCTYRVETLVGALAHQRLGLVDRETVEERDERGRGDQSHFRDYFRAAVGKHL